MSRKKSTLAKKCTLLSMKRLNCYGKLNVNMGTSVLFIYLVLIELDRSKYLIVFKKS